MSLPVTVVLPVRRAVSTVRSTLEALLAQADRDGFDVIAAVWEQDPTAAILRACGHPRLKLLIARQPSGIPQLRRDAVQSATTPFVVIAEDHCLVPADWVRSLAGKMKQTGADVMGGSVANGRRTWVGWAQYFTRYTSFFPETHDGPAHHLPGNNACYSRPVLEAHREAFRDGFWEAEFNQLLRASNARFHRDATLSVEQRQQRSVLEYAILRFRHGRCYGGRRVKTGVEGRARLVLRAPLIPLILLARALRAVMKAPRYSLHFLGSLPLFVPYILCWSAGELCGYLAGTGNSCVETD